MCKEKNYFEILSQVDVKNKIEKKSGASYLTWSWAWGELLKNYPTATYEIIRYENSLPYVYDNATGYLVSTQITIEDITREMWLPVMNGANKAMKKSPYDYKTKSGVKNVEAATMFDINKTIMRCLVKNIAMFGLGLHIFAGEDMPESIPDEVIIEKISKDQLGTIEKLLKEADMESEFFTKIMKLESMKDLPKAKFDGVLEKLNKRIELNKPKENANT